MQYHQILYNFVKNRHQYQFGQMRSSDERANKVLAHLSLLPTPPHPSFYQVSFSSLRCFLKCIRTYQTFSVCQRSIITVIGILSETEWRQNMKIETVSAV
jgi:hypothetical protein